MYQIVSTGQYYDITWEIDLYWTEDDQYGTEDDQYGTEVDD